MTTKKTVKTALGDIFLEASSKKIAAIIAEEIQSFVDAGIGFTSMHHSLAQVDPKKCRIFYAGGQKINDGQSWDHH